MKYKYLIQDCNSEILNLSLLEPSVKEKIKVIFMEDQNGKLLRHWSQSSATNSFLYPNSIYFIENKPSCSGVLMPQTELEYLKLSEVVAGYSTLPQAGDILLPRSTLPTINANNTLVEDVKLLDGEIFIKLNKKINISINNDFIEVEFFNSYMLPGSVEISEYCLDF